MGAWLRAICLLLIAGGLAIPMVTGAAKTPSPITLGNVSEAHFVEIRDPSGSTVLSGEFRSRVDSLGNTEKDAALTDSRGQTVIGEVELEIPSRARSDRRPELEVDVIGLPPRETFRVVIDDRTVGIFTTDDRGSIDEELRKAKYRQQPETQAPGALLTATPPGIILPSPQTAPTLRTRSCQVECGRQTDLRDRAGARIPVNAHVPAHAISADFGVQSDS